MTATTLRPLDLAAILIYLLGMTMVGAYFARRNTSTEEYFVGNRSFRGWVIGLSMVGTMISSVTFLAFPGNAFSSDWSNLVSNLALPFVAILAVVFFAPFYRRSGLISAFEYLNLRFGPLVRLYGVISFLIIQLLRVARILFLMSLPVALLSGAPLPVVIICTGIFIAFYTIAGGIEAVIWTDVIQSIVLLLGGLLCVGFIAWKLPGGITEIVQTASRDNKFNMIESPPEIEKTELTEGEDDLQSKVAFFFSRKTLWVVALLGVFEFLFAYSCDQTTVQRYAAAKSPRDARNATILLSVLAVPTWMLFFFVGTSVYVFYQVYPDPQVVELAGVEVDAVFPRFILTQIPAGIGGIVIAGVMAAAMSSLDSSINSMATVTVVDLLKPYLLPGRDDRFYLRAARIIAAVAAVMMVAGAIILNWVPKENMNSLSWIVASVFGGCLVGLFLLGMFTTRVDYVSVVIALVPAVGLNIYFMLSKWLPETWQTNIHNYWVTILVNLLFVAVALGVSLFRPKPTANLEKLTVWTRK